VPGHRKETAVALLTILTACYNEEGNGREVYEQVRGGDGAIPELRVRAPLHRQRLERTGPSRIPARTAQRTNASKVIVNTRNFRPTSALPTTRFLQARRDAVLTLSRISRTLQSDPQFVRKWEEGYKVVIGIKQGSRESWP